MPQSYLSYALNAGYVDHWLVAGPYARLLEVPFDRAAVALSLHDLSPGVEAPPVHLGTFEMEGATLRWDVHRALEDQLVHLDERFPTPHYLRSWAYVEIVNPAPWTGAVTLTANGPVGLWSNGKHIGGHRRFSQPQPIAEPFKLSLAAGVNRLLVRFDQIGWGTTLYGLGLYFPDLEGARLQLPDETDRADDFQAYEKLFALASLHRDVFIANDDVAVHWPEDLEDRCAARDIPAHPPISLRAQSPDGRIIAKTLGRPRAGEPTKTVSAVNLPLGEFQAVLMPDPETYSEGRVRVRRVFDLNVLPAAPDEADTRPYAKRLYEAVHLAMRQGDELLSAVAAMTLDAWQYVDGDALSGYVTTVLPSAVDRDRRLLVLLGALYRHENHDAFSQELANAIEGAVELVESPPVPGDDEVADLLRWSIRILGGQRSPDRVLPSGESGRVLRERAEVEVTDWLFRAGRYGLRSLADDGEVLDTLILALTHLADLAEATLVRELSAILLDKVLLTLALNSLHGVGIGGLLGTTATVGRVVWGSGVLNTHLWSAVGLANARSYPIPPLIPSVGQGPAGEGCDIGVAWQMEHHKDPDGGWAYRRMTYRTPEAMLTSIQGLDRASSWRSGWRAVLGSSTTVTVNAPVHAGTRADIVPNFWQGDRSPPVVAQWKDALVVRYELDDDDRMGFTHAHFPTYAFDEYALQGNWAFVRKGDAYLALTASSPLTLMRDGPGAHRELRAYGKRTFWLCQVGGAEEDGDFVAFQERVLAAEPRFDPHDGEAALRWTTLRGVTMEVDAEGQLTVDVDPPRFGDFHYVTPYCTVGFPAEQMDIQIGEELLRLDFSE
ncbi:MAG: hypothetical protein ACP5JG_04940 [Anaerolineae bacterium]